MAPLGYLLAFLWIVCLSPALAAAIFMVAVCWVLIMVTRGIFHI